MFKSAFLSIIFLGISLCLSAQTAEVKLPETPKLAFTNASSILLSTSLSQLASREQLSANGPLQSIPKTYDYHALSVFCKLDVQLDRIAPLNIRFRLGDVQYVDRLEKKGPTQVDYRR